MFVPKTKKVLYANQRLTLYSIGWLSYLSDKGRQTIRHWQRTHIIPSPLIDLGDGVRWYTAAELIGYSKIIKASNIVRGKKSLLPVQKKFADFKIQLRKAFESHSESVLHDLPKNFSIKDVMNRFHQKHWKETANKLVDRILVKEDSCV